MQKSVVEVGRMVTLAALLQTQSEPVELVEKVERLADAVQPKRKPKTNKKEPHAGLLFLFSNFASPEFNRHAYLEVAILV